MTKEELIRAIRESPLTAEDFQEILAALIETMMGQSLVGLGMDLSSGTPAATGRWVRESCKLPAGEHEYIGWRINPNTGLHEHWVDG